MTYAYLRLTCGFLLAATLATAAAAQPGAPEPPAAIDQLVPQSEADLDAVAGKGVTTTSTALTTQDLTAMNSGNTVQANVVNSGAISLDGAALSSFAGVGNIMMNTGHNNNLQSSMSVTIVVTK